MFATESSLDVGDDVSFSAFALKSGGALEA
jgi:hypothetical protein